MARMPDEEFVAEFLQEFLEDESFLILQKAMKSKSVASAFRGAHSLKGICQNLSFARLFESSSLVTKALKENDWNKADDMLPQLSDRKSVV